MFYLFFFLLSNSSRFRINCLFNFSLTWDTRTVNTIIKNKTDFFLLSNSILTYIEWPRLIDRIFCKFKHVHLPFIMTSKNRRILVHIVYCFVFLFFIIFIFCFGTFNRWRKQFCFLKKFYRLTFIVSDFHPFQRNTSHTKPKVRIMHEKFIQNIQNIIFIVITDTKILSIVYLFDAQTHEPINVN